MKQIFQELLTILTPAGTHAQSIKLTVGAEKVALILNMLMQRLVAAPLPMPTNPPTTLRNQPALVQRFALMPMPKTPPTTLKNQPALVQRFALMRSLNGRKALATS